MDSIKQFIDEIHKFTSPDKVRQEPKYRLFLAINKLESLYDDKIAINIIIATMFGESLGTFLRNPNEEEINELAAAIVRYADMIFTTLVNDGLTKTEASCVLKTIVNHR